MVTTSINIKYDLSKKDLVSGYYATSSHTEILRNVIKSLEGKNKLNSIIAYGPYGAGKSYVSALLLGIATNSFMKSDIKLLKDKLSVVDEEIASTIFERANGSEKVIPVIISGLEDNFNSTLLNNINRAIVQNNLKIIMPGLSNEILVTIKRWKKEYVKTYDKFLIELKERSIKINDFNNNIKLGDDESIQVFEEIYTKLTSGSKYHASFNSSTEEILLNVCNQLKKKGYSLMIVWDEFGRVLQNLHLSDINQFMQDIQNIAELANNGVENLTTLFIAHKPLGFYLNFATKELRDEFAKVEKRFKVLEIKSDYVTFLQITSEALKKYQFSISIENSEFDLLRKYNVFSSYLNDTELFNLVFKGAYPLHPISLYVLPKLSSIFGQNERTLFSFLYDETSNGLVGFLSENRAYYYVDRLVDFFFTNIESSYVEDFELYSIYRSNVNRIQVLVKENIDDSIRVYKFAMVWKLINGNHVLKLSSNFISYALGIDVLHVEHILEELYSSKLMRYNTLHNEWEIFKGSSLDLTKEISKVKSNLKINRDLLMKQYNENNPFRYIYSSKYNATNEITRFSIMQIINNLENETIVCDCLIDLYFKGESISQDVKSEIQIKLDYSYEDVKDILTDIYALRIIESNEYYLKEYPGVEVDIEYKMSLLKRELNYFYERIFEGKFIDSKKVIDINGKSDLEYYLSDKFDKDFPHYPIIFNDQLNMFKISSVQFNAFVKVLDDILSNNMNLNEIYVGSSPADLIYKSVIENIYLIDSNKVFIKKIRNKLKRHLNKYSNGNITDLYRIMISKPFGIRPYVAYLLLFYLIKEEWNDMLLFIGDTYIPNIRTSDLIYYQLNQPGVLKYSFSVFDNKNRNYLENLERIFHSENELVKNKSLSIRVCSNMYEWYIGLPTITQQGLNLSFSDIDFMRVIKSSRSNPTLAVQKLMDDFDLVDIQMFKNNISNHFDNYIERFIKSIMSKIGTHDLQKWALEQDDLNKKTNRFVSGLIKGYTVFEIYNDETDNLELIKWTKSSFDMLRNLVIEDIKKLDEDFEVDTVIVNGREKYVQKVDLSIKGNVTYKNIVNLINATSQYLTDSEVEKIILSLVDEYIS